MLLNARKISHLSHTRIALNATNVNPSVHRATKFSMLQNCIVMHSTFRPIFLCWSKAVGAIRARVNASASGFSRSFRETINAKARCSAIKRISVTVSVSICQNKWLNADHDRKNILGPDGICVIDSSCK